MPARRKLDWAYALLDAHTGLLADDKSNPRTTEHLRRRAATYRAKIMGGAASIGADQIMRERLTESGTTAHLRRLRERCPRPGIS